jgi:hypothetical protein
MIAGKETKRHIASKIKNVDDISKRAYSESKSSGVLIKSGNTKNNTKNIEVPITTLRIVLVTPRKMK